MNLIQGFREVVAFGITTLLSCGPSQIFGLIKSVVDTSLLFHCKTTERKLTHDLQKLNHSWNHFKTTKTIKNIAKKIGKEEITSEEAKHFIESKTKINREKIAKLYRSLKADGFALIPLLGAHFSWRIATNYKGKKFTPIFSRSIAQALEHHQKANSRFLFFGRTNKKAKPIPENLIHEPEINSAYVKYFIPVEISTKKRFIEAYFALPYQEPDKMEDDLVKYERSNIKPTHEELNKSFSDQPTIVIFHPAVAVSMQQIADVYRLKGYNILSVTMGGYRGSEGVTTSESSVLQDIEAIKLFLREKGVKEVAYHGWSMGSGLALQAATGESSVNDLKTLFVALDRPFNSAVGVGANLLGALGEGVMQAALPKNSIVELPGDKWTKTDGLNNVKKVKLLKNLDIPLICVEATGDFLMGRKKVKGIYQNNFAKDLIEARYPSDEKAQLKHLITIDSGHFEMLNKNTLSSFLTNWDHT